ncbi:MAG: tetratricopeptide repeat protein [Spirochaetales bacterium]|nr:tetratricopeptide repeat protein [Spirochaetales bacterium]
MADAEIDLLFAQALQAGKERNYIKASNLLLRIVSETDAMPQAYLYLGRSYHALGHIDLAIQFLRYFTELKPGVGAGHFFLGRAYFLRRLHARAVEELETAARLEPENSQAHALLGMARLRMRDTSRAAASLGRAVELDGENTDLYNAYLHTLLIDAVKVYRSGDIDLARDMFTFLLDAGYDGPLPQLYLAALEKRNGNYAQALHWYDRVIFSYPEDPLLHLQRARVLYQLGKIAEAVEIFEAFGFSFEDDESGADAEELDRFMAREAYKKGHLRKAAIYAKRVIKRTGRDYEMHLLLGEAFRNLGSFSKARNHFTRAWEVDRNRIEPLYGIAMVLWHVGDHKEMLTYLDKIDRIDPGNAIAAYYRALCLRELNAPSNEVIPALQNALRKNTPDKYLTTALGAEYLDDSRPDLAEKWFEKALEFAPSHQDALQGLIETYEALEEDQKSARSYELYLKKFPADLQIRNNYIHLLLDMEKFEDAIAQIQAALPISNDGRELQRLLAYCCRRTGQFVEAAVVYRNLLKDEPANEAYLRALCYCLDFSGKRKTSLELLEKAFVYLTPSVELRLIYGVLLYRESRFDDALEQFRQALDKSPDDWRAYKNMGMIYRKRGINDFAEKYFARAEKHKPS